jgi:hypothetical protein
MLVSEGEGPNNQHEVEGERGGGGGSITKGTRMVVVVLGVGCNMIDNIFF